MQRLKNTFSKRLKIARKQSGLSLRKLAPLVGTTYVSLNLWENGKAFPQERFIYKISEVLDVSSDWLLGFDNEYNYCPHCGEKL
jgi:transcriptional regulator with XRE-family HTH domain